MCFLELVLPLHTFYYCSCTYSVSCTSHPLLYSSYQLTIIPSSFSSPTAQNPERRAAVEVALNRQLSQRPTKNELKQRNIIQVQCVCVCVSIVSLVPRPSITANVVEDLVKLLRRVTTGRRLGAWHFRSLPKNVTTARSQCA